MDRVEGVIDSCKTFKQLGVADKYADLAAKEIGRLSGIGAEAAYHAYSGFVGYSQIKLHFGALKCD